MNVKCPKCGVVVDAVLTNVGVGSFRWSTTDLHKLHGVRHEWRDPANAINEKNQNQ